MKEYYKFIPEFIANGFGLVNLSALEKVYKKDKVIIIINFFHLVQAWWRKAINSLRRKIYVKKTKKLIFNLEMLPFMDYDKARKFYI